MRCLPNRDTYDWYQPWPKLVGHGDRPVVGEKESWRHPRFDSLRSRPRPRARPWSVRSDWPRPSPGGEGKKWPFSRSALGKAEALIDRAYMVAICTSPNDYSSYLLEKKRQRVGVFDCHLERNGGSPRHDYSQLYDIYPTLSWLIPRHVPNWISIRSTSLYQSVKVVTVVVKK